eukprot:10388451-Lingulodinium_polyedra.AAC.1
MHNAGQLPASRTTDEQVWKEAQQPPTELLVRAARLRYVKRFLESAPHTAGGSPAGSGGGSRLLGRPCAGRPVLDARAGHPGDAALAAAHSGAAAVNGVHCCPWLMEP